MSLRKNIQHAKNHLDFSLRKLLHWSTPIDQRHVSEGPYAQLQQEIEDFIFMFNWEPWIPKTSGKSVIVDIGARNFVYAPVWNKLFRQQLKLDSEIHGVEIDAYRRYRNFHTRADYGKYFARQIPNGYFHAMDFFKWNRPTDVALMLNPFVTPTALLEWGLPLNFLQPENLFSRLSDILRERKGVLLCTSPNDEEFNVCHKLAKAAGFVLHEEQSWYPTKDTAHQQPRLGGLWSLPVSN